MLNDSIMKVMFLQVRFEWYLHICFIYYFLVTVQIAILITLFGKLVIMVIVDFLFGPIRIKDKSFKTFTTMIKELCEP